MLKIELVQWNRHWSAGTQDAMKNSISTGIISKIAGEISEVL